jgi:hypothetical protein
LEHSLISIQTESSEDVRIFRLTAENTVSSFRPFHPESLPILTRLLYATKQGKVAADAQEARKQNKNIAKKKGNIRIIKKLAPERTLCYIRGIEFHLLLHLLIFETGLSL